MCKYHGGSYEGNLPVVLARPRSDGIQTVHVDPCIWDLVQGINDAGIQTLNCCCGHGQRPGWIALENGRQIVITKDLDECRQITADFPALSDPKCLSSMSHLPVSDGTPPDGNMREQEWDK